MKDWEVKEPATNELSEIRKKCFEHGLITMSCGVLHNVFRLMFPLLIKEDELERGLDILEGRHKGKQIRRSELKRAEWKDWRRK